MLLPQQPTVIVLIVIVVVVPIAAQYHNLVDDLVPNMPSFNEPRYRPISNHSRYTTKTRPVETPQMEDYVIDEDNNFDPAEYEVEFGKVKEGTDEVLEELLIKLLTEKNRRLGDEEQRIATSTPASRV